MSRWFATCFAILLAIPLASCGRKAPWYAPTRVALGDLIVVSAPPGAEILLDGIATGHVTPDTLTGIEAGDHVVRVSREGWTAAPESLHVQVTAADAVRAEFTLSPGAEVPTPIVLLEAFSNVSCVGCPEMAATLRALLAEPGFGLDRVVLIEYAASWPLLADPHYQAAKPQNDARMMFYRSDLFAVPTLFVNGALAGASGQPPTIDGLRAAITSRLSAHPGFTIGVSASSSDPGVITARATLRAAGAIDHPGAVVDFALVQDSLIYGSPPGTNGETDFRWIMRDFVTADGAPFPLAAHDSIERTVTLSRQAAWPLADLHVIAFVQDPLTREVLQAGYADVDVIPVPVPRFSRPVDASRTPPRTSIRRGRP